MSDAVINQLISEVRDLRKQVQYLLSLETPGTGTLATLPVTPDEMSWPYRSTSSSTTLTATDYYLEADATSGAVIITLPSAVGIAGRRYAIKRSNASGSNVTIATTGGQDIDGATTVTLSAQYSARTVVSNGANWRIFE